MEVRCAWSCSEAPVSAGAGEQPEGGLHDVERGWPQGTGASVAAGGHLFTVALDQHGITPDERVPYIEAAAL